jgi:ABC-type antimicrobial peptide transport system permease subunit
VERTNDRLASFYEVTNTYLSVFGVFGALGMVTGIAGLGFVLLRNYNYRRREFALMLATGFKVKKIRGIIFSEQVTILAAGIISGVVPAVVATLPSLKSGTDIPWLYLSSMVLIILCTGMAALFLSMKSVTGNSLISGLRKE